MSEKINASLCFREFGKLKKEIEEWNNSDSFNVNRGGVIVKAMSKKLELAFEDFLNTTADSGKEVQDDAKAAILRIDELFAAYDTFKRLCAEDSPLAPPGGSNELWRAVENLTILFAENKKLPLPTPMKDLVAMNVSHLQIAAIYGWKDSEGALDTVKVSEEIATPGTHYDPKTWVHPALARRREMIEKDWLQRQSPRSVVYDVVSENPKSNYVPPTLTEMVAIGAPAIQIARVHGISQEDAETLLHEAGTNETAKASLDPILSEV